MSLFIMSMNIFFTETHEWIDSNGRMGITQHAATEIADIVFIDLPKIGVHVEKSQEIAVIESIKVASSVYAPISGEIIRVNDDLVDTLELMNQSPMDNGWICYIRPKNIAEMQQLKSQENYQAFLLSKQSSD